MLIPPDIPVVVVFAFLVLAYTAVAMDSVDFPHPLDNHRNPPYDHFPVHSMAAVGRTWDQLLLRYCPLVDVPWLVLVGSGDPSIPSDSDAGATSVSWKSVARTIPRYSSDRESTLHCYVDSVDSPQDGNNCPPWIHHDKLQSIENVSVHIEIKS